MIFRFAGVGSSNSS